MIKYPFTINDLMNTDALAKAILILQEEVKNFVVANTIKYADPIQWNITTQYERNTVVIDPLTGTAYISVQPVPMGISLANTDYWTVVFNLSEFVTRAARNFSLNYEENTTLTATFATVKGGWLVWNDTLYVANVNITPGDQYVDEVGGNITRITMESIIGNMDDLLTTHKDNMVNIINEVYTAYTTLDTIIGDMASLDIPDVTSVVAALNVLYTAVNNIAEAIIEISGDIGDLDDLNTTDKTSIVAAVNEVLSDTNDVDNKVGDLDNLTTTDKSSIVAAVNEVLSDTNDVDNKVGDLDNLATTDKSSIVAAVNEVLATTAPAYYVLPEDYGAVGDGIHDDTAAIQAAVNDSNCVAFMPDKTYLVSDNISLNNGQIIDGNHSTVKIKDNIRIREIFTIDSKSNILLYNITFDMNCLNMPVYSITDYNQNAFLCKAVYLDNSENVLIANCNFINLYTWAVFVYRCVEHISIVNSNFTSPAQSQGFINEFIRVNSMWTGLLTIDNNTFTGDNTNNDFGTAALAISNVHAKSIINGNTLINCGRNSTYNHRLAAIDFYGDVYNASITNNYIEAVNMFIRLEDTKNILVDNNICKDVSVNAGPLSDGYVWVFHSDRYPDEPEIENITIRNNIFLTKTGVHKGNTIRIREYSSDHNTIFIKNVIIENNKFYRGKNKGFSAIETDGRVNGLYIKGNVFDDDTDIAYIIRFTENTGYNTANVKCMITDNTFKGYIAIKDDSNISVNMLPLIIARNIFMCENTKAIDVHKGVFLDNYFSFGGIKTDGDAVNNSFISGNIFDDTATNPITSTNTVYTNNIKGTNILSNQ